MGFDFFREDDERPESLKESAKDLAPQDTQATPDLFADDKEETVIETETKVEEINNIVKEETNDKEIKADSEELPIEDEASVEDQSVEEEAILEEAIKKISARFGESDIEVPVEARFKHKVDGEEVEVSVQELLNNYSGKTSWDKKFTELSGDRDSHKKDLDVVNKYINEFAEVSKKDKVEGLIKLAESVGINPLEYKKQLRSELLNKYQDYLQMDDDQRSHYEQAEELDYYRRQRESDTQRQSEKQAQEDLQRQYVSIQETHNIDNDRLNFLATELSDVYKAEINPENVLELHNSLTRLDKVDNALKQINPSFIEDDSKVLQLESLVRGNPQMTDDQILDMATKLYGNDVEKAVVNLAKKAPVSKETAKATDKPHKFHSKLNHIGSNINFFDD